MTFLRTALPQGNAALEPIYAQLESMFGMVPKVFQSMSLRPDLLAPLVNYVQALMVEESALPRATKELLAAYVSKLNACAY